MNIITPDKTEKNIKTNIKTHKYKARRPPVHGLEQGGEELAARLQAGPEAWAHGGDPDREGLEPREGRERVTKARFFIVFHGFSGPRSPRGY